MTHPCDVTGCTASFGGTERVTIYRNATGPLRSPETRHLCREHREQVIKAGLCEPPESTMRKIPDEMHRASNPVYGRCNVEGCRFGAKRKGLCERHYQRALAENRLDEFAPVAPVVEMKIGNSTTPGVCRIEGCSTPDHKGGLCHKHYRAAEKAGRLEELARAPEVRRRVVVAKKKTTVEPVPVVEPVDTSDSEGFIEPEVRAGLTRANLEERFNCWLDLRLLRQDPDKWMSFPLLEGHLESIIFEGCEE
ncbi:MAG: hypothetical protein WC911_02045 [Thermoleophilia bacterium]